MKEVMNVSMLCTLGCDDTLEALITRPIQVRRLTSNAFEMNGCFYISSADQWLDLFVMNGLAYREFELGTCLFIGPGECLKIHYTGRVPPGWVAGSEFRLVLTLELG